MRCVKSTRPQGQLGQAVGIKLQAEGAAQVIMVRHISVNVKIDKCACLIAVHDQKVSVAGADKLKAGGVIRR